MIIKIQSLLLGTIILAASSLQAADSAAAESATPDYVKVTQDRAAKIVANLGIKDSSRMERVTDVIAKQYQALSRIHDARDAKIEALKSQGDGDGAARDAEVQKLQDGAKAETDQLHAAFMAKLVKELSPHQVEKVKDGMTYSVAPNTYRVYLQMYPSMTDPQKQQVLDWLHEAREIAMDAGDSKAKHAVFGKYKGRINNYLVKEGFDLKQGEQNLKKASASASETKSK